MRKYEIMLILPAEADEAVVAKATDRVALVIKESGGEILTTSRGVGGAWPTRSTTSRRGAHVVSEFTADPDVIRELDRVLSLADEVIRFKIVVREPPKARPQRAEPEKGATDTAKADTAKAETAEPETGVAETTPASAPA